jgi:hypothetical protein
MISQSDMEKALGDVPVPASPELTARQIIGTEMIGRLARAALKALSPEGTGAPRDERGQ